MQSWLIHHTKIMRTADDDDASNKIISANANTKIKRILPRDCDCNDKMTCNLTPIALKFPINSVYNPNQFSMM